MQRLFLIISYDKKKSSRFDILRENCYNLITNLLTDEFTRSKFRKGSYFTVLEAIVNKLSQYNSKVIDKKAQFAASALGVFQNLAFHEDKEGKLKELYNELNLGDVLINRFLSLDYQNEKFVPVIERSLQILAKLDF